MGSPCATASSGSPLVATPAIGDAAWRTQVVAAVRPIRLAADQARGVNGLGGHAGWRPVVAALERIATCAVIAEHAVLHGNEAGVLLVLRHRLPRDLQALNAALQALVADVHRVEDAMALAFAC